MKTLLHLLWLVPQTSYRAAQDLTPSAEPYHFSNHAGTYFRQWNLHKTCIYSKSRLLLITCVSALYVIIWQDWIQLLLLLHAWNFVEEIVPTSLLMWPLCCVVLNTSVTCLRAAEHVPRHMSYCFIQVCLTEHMSRQMSYVSYILPNEWWWCVCSFYSLSISCYGFIKWHFHFTYLLFFYP